MVCPQESRPSNCNCCKGALCGSWKCEPIDSWEFQSTQALVVSYSPTKHLYPCDQVLHVSTVIPTRQKRLGAQERSTGQQVPRTALQALIEGDKSRGCGDLDKVCTHLDSVRQVSKERVCASMVPKESISCMQHL